MSDTDIRDAFGEGWTLEKIDHSLSGGQGRHVPAGLPHQLYNEVPEALEFLVVSAPLAHGDRVLLAGPRVNFSVKGKV